MKQGGITVSIGSAMHDQLFGKVQVPIKSFLEKRAEAFEQQSVLDKLFRMEQSRHWAEGYGGMTAMGDFVDVGEGGAYPKTDFEDAYMQDIKNETFKLSFSATREAMEDMQLGKVRMRANGLITSYYRTREKFGRTLYAGGLVGTTVPFGGTGKTYKCASADGVSLFNTQHVCKVTGAVQSNKFADALTAETLGKLETRMQNITGDNGELLAVTPDTILIPNDAALKQAAFEAIGSDKDPDSSNNGFNYQYGRWNVICDPYLTHALAELGITDAPWILLDSEFLQLNDGAIFQDRAKLSVSSRIADNDDNVWTGYARFAAGFVDWRFAAVGGMTGGGNL